MVYIGSDDWTTILKLSQLSRLIVDSGSWFHNTGLPRSGKKFWKMKNFTGRGKVRELHFQSGKFKKNEKSPGKVREFQNCPKMMLVNRLLEILVSIICKQY